MSSSRPVDSKREEFRKYLERAGVMDSLTKVLTSLYEEQEKPADALEYVHTHLAAGQASISNIDVSALKEENAKLKERLAEYESGESKPHVPHSQDQSIHSTTLLQ